MDYIIGDTHFGSKTIINNSHRPFKSSDAMDNCIIENWNKVVTNEDRVFINGDFFDIIELDYVQSILKQLNGKKILIMGNHDIGYENFYRDLEVEVIEFPIVYSGFYIVSHEPLYVSMKSPYANIFAHVHDNPTYKDVSCRSFCTSAERINYTPISLEEVKKSIMEAQ